MKDKNMMKYTSEDDEDREEKKKIEEETLKKTKDIVENKKDMQVFWSKEKLKNIKDKFYAAGMKIKEKTKRDWDEVMENLKKGDVEEVKNRLLDEDFKTFYKLVIKKDPILQEILKHGYPETVL